MTQTPEPRFGLLGEEDARKAAVDAGVPEYMADLNVFRMLLKSGTAANGINQALFHILFKSELDNRLRELIIMRIAWVTGSVYEWGQHYRIARGVGITDDEITGLREWRAFDGFGDADRAVLAATDDILDDGRVSDATWAECAALFSEPELVATLAAIGLWQMMSAVLESLRVPLDDDLGAPWPPDGAAPR